MSLLLYRISCPVSVRYAWAQQNIVTAAVLQLISGIALLQSSAGQKVFLFGNYGESRRKWWWMIYCWNAVVEIENESDPY